MEGLFAGLVALSLVPPLLYALFLRSREHHDREPLRAVVGTFVWGGTIGVAVAVLLHILFQFGYDQAGGPLAFDVDQGILAAVVAAPIVEELAKGLGLRGLRRNMRELEDGIIYGASVGLGFAATENLVYGVTALLDGGFGVAFETIAVRTFSSMLLHASASGLLGFGYGRMVLVGGTVGRLLPYYLAAVALHALYNLLVGREALLGLAVAILIVALIMGTLRRRIDTLDAMSPENWR